jgi:hypothetical protein
MRILVPVMSAEDVQAFVELLAEIRAALPEAQQSTLDEAIRAAVALGSAIAPVTCGDAAASGASDSTSAPPASARPDPTGGADSAAGDAEPPNACWS